MGYNQTIWLWKCAWIIALIIGIILCMCNKSIGVYITVFTTAGIVGMVNAECVFMWYTPRPSFQDEHNIHSSSMSLTECDLPFNVNLIA